MSTSSARLVSTADFARMRYGRRLAQEAAVRAEWANVTRPPERLDSDEITDLMGAILVNDQGKPTVTWVGGVGMPSEGPRSVRAWDGKVLVRRGERPRVKGAVTYRGESFAFRTSKSKGGRQHKLAKARAARTLSAGLARLAQLQQANRPAPYDPPAGCLPCPFVGEVAYMMRRAFEEARAELPTASEYAAVKIEDAWCPFDRFTGELVTFEKGSTRTDPGDWRDPDTASYRRVRFPVGTGQYV